MTCIHEAACAMHRSKLMSYLRRFKSATQHVIITNVSRTWLVEVLMVCGCKYAISFTSKDLAKRFANQLS